MEKRIKISRADLFVLFTESISGSALGGFAIAAAAPQNSTPQPVPLSPAGSLGNAPRFSTAKPPAPSAATPGGPTSWLLQYAGDITQVTFADIYLVCEFAAS